MTQHTEFVTRLTTALPRTDIFAADFSGIIIPNLPGPYDRAQSFDFFEPPYPQRTFYIPIHRALTMLGMATGAEEEHAQTMSAGFAHRVMRNTPNDQRYVVSNYWYGRSYHTVPVESLLSWLTDDHTSAVFFEVFQLGDQHRHNLAAGLAREHARILNSAGLFIRFDRTDPTTLANVPDRMDPRYMIQYMPGWPWETERFPEADHFYAWRDTIIPIANDISDKLGKCAYMFTDPDDTDYDDNAHRFFVLHWLASYMPEDIFVQYLVAASGCDSVDHFKSELIKVQNFTQEFEMHDCWGDNDAWVLGCKLDPETFEVSTWQRAEVKSP